MSAHLIIFEQRLLYACTERRVARERHDMP